MEIDGRVRNALPVSMYRRVEHLMQAFTIRDMQTGLIMLDWMSANNIDIPMVRTFLQTFPHMKKLKSLGYFNPNVSPAHAKVIKEFEQSLPKDLRRELRKERLKEVQSGPMKAERE